MKKIFINMYVWLFLALLLWASAYVGIRIGLRSYSPGALGFFRYLVASIVMIPFFFKYRFSCHLHCLDVIKMVVIGIIGFGVYNVALNYGEITTTSAIASFIICQSPVIMVLLAVLFLNESINLMGLSGIVISVLGVLLIAFSKRTGWKIDVGILYVILAAFAGALYSILQKPLLKRVSSMQLVAIMIWGGTASMGIFAPQLCHEITRASWFSTLTVIYLGIFPGAVSYLIWSIVLTHIPAVRAASYIYIIPILTTILGLFIHEYPLWLSLLGGVVALIGSIITHISFKHDWRILTFKRQKMEN